MNETLKELIALKTVTRMTGVLHELQIRQLSAWPLIMLGDVRSSEFAFSHEDKEITFNLRIQGNPKHLKNFEQFDASVKMLLGDDFLVRVKVKDKVVYRGLRNKNSLNPEISSEIEQLPEERTSWRDNLIVSEAVKAVKGK